MKRIKTIKPTERIKITRIMKQTKQIKQMKQMKRKHKRLGIIGGLGPESSCSFCLNVNKQFRQIKNCQPDIVLELLPISAEAEKGIINGDMGEEHFQLITKAVKRLNKADVDFIVIPCNTVHVFIDKLRAISKKPILSIMEECAKECLKNRIKKVGLLGSTKTVKEGLFDKELKKIGVRVLLPDAKVQERITSIIIKIVHNHMKPEDKLFILNVIKNLKKSGAEAVVLGCTELPLFIKSEDSCLPVVSSLNVLENAAVKLLLNVKTI
ncbi:aspartate/glutamate racemase family protein [Candidatus Woesearchaeota archaeon]|nr:aspartate/glutamate racemase family protein [Candidatus Woesearchaeota archaeon]